MMKSTKLEGILTELDYTHMAYNLSVWEGDESNCAWQIGYETPKKETSKNPEDEPADLQENHKSSVSF